MELVALGVAAAAAVLLLLLLLLPQAAKAIGATARAAVTASERASREPARRETAAGFPAACGLRAMFPLLCVTSGVPRIGDCSALQYISPV